MMRRQGQARKYRSVTPLRLTALIRHPDQSAITLGSHSQGIVKSCTLSSGGNHSVRGETSQVVRRSAPKESWPRGRGCCRGVPEPEGHPTCHIASPMLNRPQFAVTRDRRPASIDLAGSEASDAPSRSCVGWVSPGAGARWRHLAQRRAPGHRFERQPRSAKMMRGVNVVDLQGGVYRVADGWRTFIPRGLGQPLAVCKRPERRCDVGGRLLASGWDRFS